MRLLKSPIIFILFIISLLFMSLQFFSSPSASFLSRQDFKYPKEDFYNRNIELPIDHFNSDEGTFTLYYQLTSNFDFNRPTIIFFYDSQQSYGKPGIVDDLAKRYDFYEDFNVVRYQYRGRKYSYINVKNPDGTVDWAKAYRVMSSKQAVEDIERVRQDLFKEHPETKILLYGRSGGGYLIQEYLAKYSHNVRRAFIGAAPNPLIMEKLGFIESKYLFDILNATDSSLHEKLKAVLAKDIVPSLHLQWILLGIPYRDENPGEKLSKIINELHEGRKDMYNEYLNEKGRDFSKLWTPEEELDTQKIGSYLRPLECDGKYLLGPAPDYVDPLYACLRKVSETYVRLIEEEKVAPLEYPALETFKEIDTEVFYLAGKHDHVSPYQIGIELGKYFKHYELFIADDNHNMTIHKACYPLLRNAFFKYGIGSKELQEVRRSLECKESKLE